MPIVSARRRLLLLLAALPILLITLAFGYQFAMARLEGETRSFWDSFEWAAETITTTGYGAEASWDHPLMVLMVVATQFFGVFLVYMLVPLLLLPLLEERFEQRLPRKVGRLRDHVVIFGSGAAVESLIDDLARACPVVVVELDEQRARRMVQAKLDEPKRFREVHPLYGAQVDDALRAARLEHARALVANGSDEANTSAVLIARESGFEGDVLALVHEPFHRKPLARAGATAVYTPRHVLGAALAARASRRVQPRIRGIERLSPPLRVAEVRVDSTCELAGTTLAEADAARRTGALIVGQWVAGTFDAHPVASTRVEPRAILLALGQPDALDRLAALATGGRSRVRDGPIFVVGAGEVGRKVATLLREVDEPVVLVDENRDLEGVDVFGDIADGETLERLDLDSAQALVLALDSDTTTLFATLLLKSEAPDLQLVARVNRRENIERLYRAGADFAISISDVAGEILLHRLLGQPTRPAATDLQILRSTSAALPAGKISGFDLRQSTGCSIVAVERDGEILTMVEVDSTIQPGDAVFVCGHVSAIDRFQNRFGPS
ncbi:MAG: NAD-binding protein [Acidobacteriota bacterium]